MDNKGIACGDDQNNPRSGYDHCPFRKNNGSRYKKEILGDTGVMEVLEYEQ